MICNLCLTSHADRELESLTATHSHVGQLSEFLLYTYPAGHSLQSMVGHSSSETGKETIDNACRWKFRNSIFSTAHTRRPTARAHYLAFFKAVKLVCISLTASIVEVLTGSSRRVEKPFRNEGLTGANDLWKLADIWMNRQHGRKDHIHSSRCTWANWGKDYLLMHFGSHPAEVVPGQIIRQTWPQEQSPWRIRDCTIIMHPHHDDAVNASGLFNWLHKQVPLHKCTICRNFHHKLEFHLPHIFLDTASLHIQVRLMEGW